MRRVPPWVVRRGLITPLVLALDVVLLALFVPAWVLALLLSPLAGGSRARRMLAIVAAYAAGHLRAVFALAALWVRGGFGRRMETEPMQAAHYDVMGRFVGRLYDVIVAQARVSVGYAESEAAARVLDTPDRPLVVLARHAGEGDTLLVIHELLCRHGRRPRIVMHEALRLDPMIDLLGHRLPHRFIDPRGGDTEKDVADLARGLDARGALIIFPEGVNFSEASRRRSIERLEAAGHDRQAAVAREMRHVSAPRPGGALAALEANPDADVVIMGHAGFPTGFGEMWRRLPHPQRIEVRLWHEPAESIPAGRAERIDWLFERWQRLDEWVQARAPHA